MVKESGDLTFEQPVEGIGDTQYEVSYKCILFYAFLRTVVYNHLDVIIVILLKINYRPNRVSDVLVASAREATGEDHVPRDGLAALSTGPIPRRGEGRCRNISECFV